MVERLKSFILERLSNVPDNLRGISGFSVGIEHEFFLVSKNDQPASHSESQRFLKGVAATDGWHIQEAETNNLGHSLMRVSRNNANGRYTALKYDHHPHLMEIAFEYHDNLNDLSANVIETFKILERVAFDAGVRIAHVPFCSLEAGSSKVTSELADFVNLRHYRSNLLAAKNKNVDPNLANYAAVIAATQVHIGGTGWWKTPDFVRQLYLLEPDIQPAAYRFLNDKRDAVKIFEQRWTGYKGVFKGFPLVAFPDLEDWSMETWVAAILRSPLLGGPMDRFAGKTALETDVVQIHGLAGTMKLARDLQIIRPKLFGTLEFRSDPSQPTEKAILAIAALRLAACVGVANGYKSKHTYGEARKEWSSGPGKKLSPELLELSKNWLRARQLGEEKYLGAFDE